MKSLQKKSKAVKLDSILLRSSGAIDVRSKGERKSKVTVPQKSVGLLSVSNAVNVPPQRSKGKGSYKVFPREGR